MKGRPALLLPPSFQTINDKQDAYLQPLDLRKLAPQSKRYWSFHSMPTTIALPENRYAKSLNGFANHLHEPDFMELIREYSQYGCPRPSGYADVFHEVYRSPRVRWSVNVLFAPFFSGGWQAALVNGIHRGRFYRYDMRSAYLWAATLGMPDTRTYRRSLKPWKKKDGLFRVKLTRPNKLAPFPFDRAREVIATNLEIETYNLEIGEVVDGVTWDNVTSPEPILSAVRKVSTWKQAGRAYWGRWGQSQKIKCFANGKSWELPNVALNIPWAHSIVSRVKMRLWEHSRNAIHVFVDSVITSDVIRTGTDLGDWRLEKTYDGVFVRGPGQYGGMDEARLERFAGVAIDSPLRDTSVALRDVAGRTV